MAKLEYLLSKYLINTIPIEDTYFIKTKIPDIKLNKDLVFLNYSLLSPFKDGDVVFYKDKKNLYIWLTKNRLNSKKIHIPEGFLLYKTYKDKKDSIIIKKTQKDNWGIVVVKDGDISTQFFKKDLEETYIDLLKKEHSLSDPEIIKIDKNKEYKTNIDDIIKFAQSLNIDTKSILTGIYEELKVFAIIFLFLISIFDISIYEYTTSLINKKKTELKVLTKSNEKIKEQFGILEKNSDFFKKFTSSELKYPNLGTILSVITKNVLDNNGMIVLYSQSGSLIDMRAVSNASSSIVSSLMSTGYFSSVEIINVSRYYKDKTKEVGHFELRIKAVKHDG